MTLPTPYPGATRAPASCGELFRVFNRMALQGFGGVLAVAQHELVEREQWMDKGQFVEMLSLGQVLPGPNIVNLSMMVGDHYFGWRGAVAALGGMLVVPTVIVLAAAVLYERYASVPEVAGALRGMGVVSAGLVVATALKLMSSLKRNVMGPMWCGAFALLMLAGITVWHRPMVVVLPGLGLPAIAVAWWHLRKGRR